MAARATQAALTQDPAHVNDAAAAGLGDGPLRNPTPRAGLGLRGASEVRAFTDGVRGLQ